MNAKTETPRTDAVEQAVPETANLCIHWHAMDDHARQLERELTAANRALETERKKSALVNDLLAYATVTNSNLTKQLETERAEHVRKSEDLKHRAEGCEGAFNLIQNCADTLRSRDFGGDLGPIDIRVIAMAKALDRERDVRRQLAEDMENLCVPYTKSKKNGLPSGVYVQRFRFEKAESALAASRALDQDVCPTMERPKKDCGCPDCGRTLVDYAGE